MENWPEMGSTTAHPTGATFALGDPSVSLNAMGGLESYHRLEEAPVHGLMVAAWLTLEPVALTGAVGVCEQDSGRRNAPLRHRGSIAWAAYPVAYAL